MIKFSDSLYATLQRLLPQHGLSRLAGRLADCRWPWVRDALVRTAIRRYQIDLDEAAEPDWRRHACFNDFFVRALRQGTRPVADEHAALTAPADGVVSAAGALRDHCVIQAKGHAFPLPALVGEQGPRVAALSDGSFATIYLSPRDYHRVHAPLAGRLIAAEYFPGQLFSVNPRTDAAIPGLYAVNERLVCWFATELGDVAVVMVGALLVAGIETLWQGRYRAGLRHRRRFHPEDPAATFARGAELGRFRFGSTVIVIAPPGVAMTVVPGQTVRVGQSLASAADNPVAAR